MRIPGTRHGDWWSTRGLWIYAAVGTVSLLSKYLIKFRGKHVFNPSNFGLVLVLPDARQPQNRAAPVLVGADVDLADPGARDDRHGRAR